MKLYKLFPKVSEDNVLIAMWSFLGVSWLFMLFALAAVGTEWWAWFFGAQVVCLVLGIGIGWRGIKELDE